MDYHSYLKSEIEKIVFIEIKEELTLHMEGAPVLKKGDYPVLSEDLIRNAKAGIETLTPNMLIRGMLFMLACDAEFKWNDSYREFLRSIPELNSYIILEIQNAEQQSLKLSVLYAEALTVLFPKKEYSYNKVLLLMQLYENTSLAFLEEEILEQLKQLVLLYEDFIKPYYHLAEYYLDKDMDLAKMYLQRCREKDNGEIAERAEALLQRIGRVDQFDEAVKYIKAGEGAAALKILIPISCDEPENFDAKYYAAVAYRQTENYTKALLYLKELTDFAERAEVYSEIALNLAELDAYGEAMDYLKKALKITPDDTGILCNMGVCQLNMGELSEALKTFELVHRMDPQDEIALSWIEQIQEYYKR